MMIGNLLSIHQTYGKIGLEIQNAQLSIQQPKAQINMHQELPQVQIETTPLEMHIDQQDCWNEVGLKDNAALIYDNGQEARQAAMEGIARRAEEGTRLLSIENGGKPIIEMAKEASNPPPKTVNIAFLPQSRPKIDFTGGEVHFSLQEGRVDWEVIPQKPIIEVSQYPSVNVYMQQWPSINIEYLGNNLDRRG